MLNVYFKGQRFSHSHSSYVEMILIIISAHGCYYCTLWRYKGACKINNIPWWASPLLKASQLKTILRTRKVNKWKPICQWLHYIPAHHCTCVHYVPRLPASFLRSCQAHCPGYRCLVELSVSLSPVFLPPHSISSAADRCWDLLISIPATSHCASGCLFHLCREQSTKVFSGQWRRINHAAYWILISKIIIHEVQLTLELFRGFQPRGIARFCCEVSYWCPCWVTSRTSSPLNDRTVWK